MQNVARSTTSLTIPRRQRKISEDWQLQLFQLNLHYGGKKNPAFLPSTYMTPAKTSVSITQVLPVGCHVWMKSCCCCVTGRRSSVTWLSRAPPSSSCCRFAGSRLQLVYKEHYSKRRRSGEEAGEREVERGVEMV